MNTDDRTSVRVRQDPVPPAVVEFPAVVMQALAEFGDMFACEPERVHFAEYLGDPT